MANRDQVFTIGTSAQSQKRMLDAIQRNRINWMPTLFWSQRVKYSDYSDSDTSEALDLNATFTGNLFPKNVTITGAWVQRVTDFAGGSVSAATIILGDAADDNQLLTQLDVFTGAKATAELERTPAAAGFADGGLWETGYVPLLQLDTTTANIDTLTAGELIIGIEYKPLAVIA